MTSFEDTIYPCLYIARNVKATFSDVKITKPTKKAVSMEIKGECKTKYIYGEELDLTGIDAIVTYNDLF